MNIVCPMILIWFGNFTLFLIFFFCYLRKKRQEDIVSNYEQMFSQTFRH